MVEGESPASIAELEQRASRLEAQRRFPEAACAYDAALRAAPSSQCAAEGRARVALALRESNAVEHCSRALAFHEDYPDRQLSMILTAAGELGSEAIPLFEDYLRAHPQNVTAHQMLSELRAEWGAGDGFAESYSNALREYPANKPLLMSYWNTLARAGRVEEALESIDAQRSLFEGDRDVLLLEMNIASHTGHLQRAAKLVDRLDAGPDAQIALGQYRLQTGDPGEAAKLLDLVVKAQPDNLSAWALLELAWRIIGDARHRWLIGQPGLYGTRELALSSAQLAEVAAALRTLHRSRAQPIGQSVRGGTQTAGQLFIRSEPEIGLLTDALAAVIRDFVSSMPPADPSHPLLKHRNMGMAFGPSWSVRLTEGGFHAAHFHPGGILSSACYIEVPQELADPNEKPGWLEIGRPPPELGLDLPAITTIEPRKGRLVLFPSFLFHGTRPFAGGERLTVAFDLVPVPMDS